MMTFSNPQGTNDILPAEWPYWNFVLRQVEEVAHLFGYLRIETPSFADTELFARTSGVGSDVVQKEMYTFRDRGGDQLTLRPEGTAPVMRAYLQHGMHKLPQPVKLYYVERMYRQEAPQHGRYREHHQFGCEAIGVEDAYVDVEVLSLLVDLHTRLGLRDLTLHLNSIGDKRCRPRYEHDLVAYLQEHIASLAGLDRERLERNPLRVLDSKEPASQEVIGGAPRSLDYLCDACQTHWDRLRRGLDLLDIRYVIDHRLVRGLDYYTRTVFEFIPPREGAQSTVDAGGRYDGLSEAMGGPPVPGIGFGAGIERLILGIKENCIAVPEVPPPTVYIAHFGDRTADAALLLADKLRKAGIATDMALGQRSLKAQMRHADTWGAPFAAIIGEDELAEAQVTLRDLRSGDQRRVPTDEVVDAVTRVE